MARRRKTRLHWKRGRAYGDFRDHADVGGKREALIPDGETCATQDERVAQRLISKRLDELEALCKGIVSGVKPVPLLRDYIPKHLKRKELKARPSTIRRDEFALDLMLRHLGQGTRKLNFQESQAPRSAQS